MSLPVPANTTCDVYHGTNAPPNPPDVAGVSCYLEERFRNIKPTMSPGIVYDHILRVEATVDIRDQYNGAPGGSETVYVPNKNGTGFKVMAVARVGRGTALDHKIVYLQRTGVSWPTNDV